MNPFRYRGYYYDTETGFYYLNSRYYSPEFGRFISADAYVSTGQGIVGNNMYAYCNNNPANYKDKSGSIPTPITWVGTGSLASLAFIDGPLPIADVFVLIFLYSIYVAANESNLPNQGDVSDIPDAPPVDAGKQGKHVPGHPNNDSTKSQWGEGETGVQETQEAWLNGEPRGKNGTVRVGTSSSGRKIKVHIDGKGRIHGYPVLHVN